jgi:hypothetical protein
MSKGKTDPWVFRDCSLTVRGETLLQDLASSLGRLMAAEWDPTLGLDTLIQAGQLEAALADSDSPESSDASRITDAMAEHLLSADPGGMFEAAAILAGLRLPPTLTLSTPEGFAYYNLQPLDFANAIPRLAVRGPDAVLGIRSIGTTLAALVAAALRKTGHSAERMTVRPSGHPYDRVTRFTPSQADWVRRQRECSAYFWVVDEGPGRSGSTFLSVAEALLREGVAVERILLVGSREADPDSLCARHARARWLRFRFQPVPPREELFPGCDYVGGGHWRQIFLPADSAWPASWLQMERSKFLSPDRRQLFKFEGLGATGEMALARAKALAEAGMGPTVEKAEAGFACYRIPPSRPLEACDLNLSLLDRIAAYAAFRAGEFRVSSAAGGTLAEMVRFNFELEFEQPWEGDLDPLASRAPVVTDGRMQPHEWMRTGEQLLKTDAASHGDDHFFPGPCDVAWDLAGAAVEWDLGADAVAYLLSRFWKLTGDDAGKRFRTLALAYAVLRLAYCRMALTTVGGTPEQARFERAGREYLGHVLRYLPPAQASSLIRSDARRSQAVPKLNNPRILCSDQVEEDAA